MEGRKESKKRDEKRASRGGGEKKSKKRWGEESKERGDAVPFKHVKFAPGIHFYLVCLRCPFMRMQRRRTMASYS